MRAILIDPHIKSFTEIDFNNSSDILNLIDADHFDVATVTRYEKTNFPKDGLYVDDEGVFKANQKFFALRNTKGFWGPHYPTPLGGKALLLCADEQGETIGTDITIETLEEEVYFIKDIKEFTDKNMDANGQLKFYNNWKDEEEENY
tara:strand:+ start:6433 stop:6873 length:441 start_codon:yes stop_codon:yes gene_type:complete